VEISRDNIPAEPEKKQTRPEKPQVGRELRRKGFLSRARAQKYRASKKDEKGVAYWVFDIGLAGMFEEFWKGALHF
jgi:hypothetical protein